MALSATSLSSSHSSSQLNLSGRLYRLSTVRSSPSFSLMGKPHDQRSTGVPGPGSYSPPSPNSPGFHFAASPREAPEHESPLGPGRYETQEPARVVVSHDFPHSPRVLPGTLPPAWAPGPGAYATRRSLGAEGRKTTMSPRIAYDSGTKTPGPGAYGALPQQPKLATRTGFGTASKEVQHRSESPGPGAYSVVGSPSGPRFSMGIGRTRTMRAAPPRPGVVRVV